MRTKKAIINVSANMLSLLVVLIPNMIVRKVFLQSLGSDMLGLNSLYSNIIGWLSILEMGIGTTIIYSLYKPFAQDDKEIIRSYIRFYGEFYKKVGIIILLLGIFISLFIELFINGNVDTKIARTGFLVYLLNTLLSYMFTHKICILNVAQEGYKVSIGTTISKLVIFILQMLMLNTFPNFIIYILIQVIVNFAYYIIINLHIRNKYAWINEGKEELNSCEKKLLLKNVKAMFMHKIGSLVVLSTDNIIISKFIGLMELGIYSNYYMVIDALQSVVSKGLSGITASIGNMLTDEDTDKAYKIHKKIFFMNFWVVSFIVISLYNTLNQFIVLWVGEKYLLETSTFIVVLFNLYFSAMRGSVEKFQEGSGNFYQDRYAPLYEAAINIISSIILAKYWGITGVFFGTLISNITVIFWTKPYVVYKYVFNKKINEYFKMYFMYLFVGLVPLVVTSYVTLPFKYSYNIKGFIINCMINIITINLLYTIMLFNTSEFKYYLNILKKVIKRKII